MGGFEQPAPEVAAEIDPEEAERVAKIAAARAKLAAKGLGKGQAKKKEVKPAAGPEINSLVRPRFIPTAEWQEVLPEHVCPRGLQFRMDVATGRNFARLPP